MIAKKEFLEKYNISDSEFKKSGAIWPELEAIYNHFDSIRHDFEPTARDIAERLLKVKSVHSVRYRIKESEHLIEKIIRKKLEDKKRVFTIENYVSEISDIIGVRALHLFKDDWNYIDSYIISTWKTKETPTANVRNGDSEELIKIYQDKKYEIKEHKYGYRSVHYILESSPTKQSFVAELQIRTIFEEAWSEIDHTIRYPYDLENPILKEYLLMFNRLAGNADEMGTYIKFLQSELQNKERKFEEELKEREQIIDDLKSKIETLEIDKKLKKELGSSIDHLIASNKSVLNDIAIINNDTFITNSFTHVFSKKDKTCITCFKKFSGSDFVFQCEECQKKSRQIIIK
ncbi:RelA/SpoT domain-containing protein [Fluviicola taffensis]|uniref:RelA/SpoT domain protein n=1 Tax=Fluviicola taffensis (strain DSM 16823 / NCIMB 13979 / RW262) TaxID=755732 RepID=F2IKG8_FLUTR|nr:RelA/SpoT domain-containing protein [Fluviicola taffensis]AEA45094.1 RelA/SpoT domain protein [Fluviicola taffensis DSM 16823]